MDRQRKALIWCELILRFIFAQKCPWANCTAGHVCLSVLIYQIIAVHEQLVKPAQTAMCRDYLTVNANAKFRGGRKDKVLSSQIA